MSRESHVFSVLSTELKRTDLSARVLERESRRFDGQERTQLQRQFGIQLMEKVRLVLLTCILFGATSQLVAQDSDDEDTTNHPTNGMGEFPIGSEGEPLNFGFESGTLDNWTAEGTAFDQQPIHGPIDVNRPFGADKQSNHVGQYWIGGYEKLLDPPTGRLVSDRFEVTKPWASFLIAGGNHFETRVELVRANTDQVFLTASGPNLEELRPVVVDLRSLMGQEIYVRLIDEHTGGWGHLNFDDFRVYDRRPRFNVQEREPRNDSPIVEVYPHAGLDAVEAADVMQLPVGFSAHVAAAEPDVNQPIAMALDDRGRVWIAEAYEYPIRAAEGQGRDRILIFEDTDGDGSLDSRKIFAENLNLVSGLEVGFGGVFVGAAPYLLFIPDEDGNDEPDSDPVVLLDGFGYQDTHETLNAFIWGPDGWLYGCHGVFTHSRVGKPGTPDDERVAINAGIWRYHPVQQSFEVFAYGTSNPWGVDFDDHGQAFATACVIPHLFHIIQGARYQRQAGAHFNPNVYQDIQTIAEHRHFIGNQWNDNDRKKSDELGGGHAHAGAMIYLGGAWPEEYRGMLLMNNIHGNRLNRDTLTQQGSGFVGSRAPDFLLTGDQWSQMINMRYGPDGQMWVIDWYDANQCHHRDIDAHDRTNGRIYRVVYQNAPNVQVDLQSETNQQLVEYLAHDNDWYSRHARRVLQERASKAQLDETTRESLLTNAMNIALPTPKRLRYLWAYHCTGALTSDTVQVLLNDEDQWIRAWTIQLAMQDSASADSMLPLLESMATHDSSQVVRLYLASAAQRVAQADRWSLLENLVGNESDRLDHNLPHMYWFAAMDLAEIDAQRALAFGMLAGRSIPQIRDAMVRRIGNSDPESTHALLIGGLAQAEDIEAKLSFLRGINESLAGRVDIQVQNGWYSTLEQAIDDSNDEIRIRVTAALDSLGATQARDDLIGSVLDQELSADLRHLAIQLLAVSPDPNVEELLPTLLETAELRSQTIRHLNALGGTNAAAAVIEVYDQLTLDERKRAIGAIATLSSSAKQLLDAVEAQQIPRTDLTADIIRQLRNLNDDEINRLIARSWGVVRETSASTEQQIAYYQRLMDSVGIENISIELGRSVYARTCQQCHTLFGTGGNVGPDLTGSHRKDLEYLLSNILEPSAVMANEYQTSVVLTADGRVRSGIVKPAAGERIELINETEQIYILNDDIDEIRTTSKSLMPEDLLGQLRMEEILALLSYLSSDGQSPILAQSENINGFFDGQSLNGWIGESELWEVRDGMIVGSSEGLDHNSFLVSEFALSDFRFQCDVRLVDNQGNSGIQFRSQPMANGEVKGYQADIGIGWWGKLYEELGRGLLVSEGGEAFVNPGDWNRYEIIAVGNRVQTFINGRKCVDYSDSLGARSGVIAFQLHSGGPMEIQFRNLDLKLIESPFADNETLASTSVEPNQSITFEKHQLDDVFRSEGVTVADFNNDGLLDVAAGSVWYSSPNWEAHSITESPEEFNPIGYSNTFCNFADDVNGDGLIDLLVVDFPGNPTWWFENPGNDTPWTKHELTPVTNNESPIYVDIDGDGKRELVCGTEGGQMVYITPQTHAEATWKLNAVSLRGAPGTDRFSHGLGMGDVNRDGRNDVLVTQGWWEAPEDLGSPSWTFHDAPFGEACANMHVYDFDDDGDQDVVSSSAHNFGIWWHEQTEDGWLTHEIDRSFSQTHALCMADINGDGKPDLITGKRYFAHNGNDPGGNEPAVMFWFELTIKEGRPEWIPHQIDHDSGMGTQFEVVDVNRDGLLDIVTSNKKGVFWHEQKRAED